MCSSPVFPARAPRKGSRDSLHGTYCTVSVPKCLIPRRIWTITAEAKPNWNRRIRLPVPRLQTAWKICGISTRFSSATPSGTGRLPKSSAPFWKVCGYARAWRTSPKGARPPRLPFCRICFGGAEPTRFCLAKTERRHESIKLSRANRRNRRIFL